MIKWKMHSGNSCWLKKPTLRLCHKILRFLKENNRRKPYSLQELCASTGIDERHIFRYVLLLQDHSPAFVIVKAGARGQDGLRVPTLVRLHSRFKDFGRTPKELNGTDTGSVPVGTDIGAES